MDERDDKRDASDYDGVIASEGGSLSPTVKTAGDGADVTAWIAERGESETEPIEFIGSKKDSFNGRTRLELAEARRRLEKARKEKNTAEKVN